LNALYSLARELTRREPARLVEAGIPGRETV